jgi:hypothetical protein
MVPWVGARAVGEACTDKLNAFADSVSRALFMQRDELPYRPIVVVTASAPTPSLRA